MGGEKYQVGPEAEGWGSEKGAVMTMRGMV